MGEVSQKILRNFIPNPTITGLGKIGTVGDQLDFVVGAARLVIKKDSIILINGAKVPTQSSGYIMPKRVGVLVN